MTCVIMRKADRGIKFICIVHIEYFGTIYEHLVNCLDYFESSAHQLCCFGFWDSSLVSWKKYSFFYSGSVYSNKTNDSLTWKSSCSMMPSIRNEEVNLFVHKYIMHYHMKIRLVKNNCTRLVACKDNFLFLF
jgi:hypothetical protein